MIKPTVGRVVNYSPGKDDASVNHDGVQPLAALIVYVWNDRMVNIAGFDSNGFPFSRTSVPLHQEGDDVPQGGYAFWMPYQKAVAAGEPPTLHAPA